MGATVQGNKTFSKKLFGLVNGRTYTFSVTAIEKEKGESGLSYPVSVSPKRGLVLKKPSALGSSAHSEERTKRAEVVALKPVSNEDLSKRVRFKNNFGMEFVLIAPGTFLMGMSTSDDTKNFPRAHNVTLRREFYMQITEVTQGQWKAIMGDNPSFYKKCGDDCPVEQVSWNEVQLFIKRLNDFEKTDAYRLPTESEWEYTCRAGTKSPFSFGECLSTTQANYCGNNPLYGCEKGLYRGKPVAVEDFPANTWGLIGMHGNVWEWCQGWFKYTTDAAASSTVPSSGVFRVIRGGGWNSYAEACRSGNRSGIRPDEGFANLGFRLIREYK